MFASTTRSIFSIYTLFHTPVQRSGCFDSSGRPDLLPGMRISPTRGHVAADVGRMSLFPLAVLLRTLFSIGLYSNLERMCNGRACETGMVKA